MYDGLCEVTYARVMASHIKGISRLSRLSITSLKGLYTYEASCY
jgi:hypothetical protein